MSVNIGLQELQRDLIGLSSDFLVLAIDLEEELSQCIGQAANADAEIEKPQLQEGNQGDAHRSDSIGTRTDHNPTRVVEFDQVGEHSRASGVKALDAPSYVYFIQCPRSKHIKIGFSSRPDRRLKELQAHSATELSLLKTIPGNSTKEKELHQRFATHRTQREWFEPAPELLTFIEEAQ